MIYKMKYFDEGGDTLQDPGQGVERQITQDNPGPGFVGTARHCDREPTQHREPCQQ